MDLHIQLFELWDGNVISYLNCDVGQTHTESGGCRGAGTPPPPSQKSKCK